MTGLPKYRNFRVKWHDEHKRDDYMTNKNEIEKLKDISNISREDCLQEILRYKSPRHLMRGTDDTQRVLSLC